MAQHLLVGVEWGSDQPPSSKQHVQHTALCGSGATDVNSEHNTPPASL